MVSWHGRMHDATSTEMGLKRWVIRVRNGPLAKIDLIPSEHVRNSRPYSSPLLLLEVEDSSTQARRSGSHPGPPAGRFHHDGLPGDPCDEMLEPYLAAFQLARHVFRMSHLVEARTQVRPRLSSRFSSYSRWLDNGTGGSHPCPQTREDGLISGWNHTHTRPISFEDTRESL